MATEVLLEPRTSLARSLESKVAVITGSSRGIGRGIARELADRGATIAINYRNCLSAAEELRNDIRADGGECELFQHDISDRHEARALVPALPALLAFFAARRRLRMRGKRIRSCGTGRVPARLSASACHRYHAAVVR